MPWYWWASIAVYVAGTVIGMAYAGSWYQREAMEIDREYRLSRREHQRSMALESAFGLCVLLTIWPLVLFFIVLYYLVTAPFRLGKRIERRRSGKQDRIREQYQQQADDLQELADGYEGSSLSRQLILDAAEGFRQRANAIK